MYLQGGGEKFQKEKLQKKRDKEIYFLSQGTREGAITNIKKVGAICGQPQKASSSLKEGLYKKSREGVPRR